MTDLVKNLYESWTAAFAEEPIEVDAGGVPAMWIAPKGAAEDRVILSIHGGGFVVGSMYTHRKLFGHLAKAAGVRALVVDYRRPPEHRHPAPVEDVVSAYAWLLDQGIDPSHVAFAGDSAGGGMVVTAMYLARDRGLPLPAAGMPFSPWFDLEGSGESQEANEETDALLNKRFGDFLADILLGEEGDRRDPHVSALQGEPAGLPPLFIQVSDAETLLDDSRAFAEKARAAGVDVRLDIFPGQQHTFQMAAGRSPVADDAIRRYADWLRPHLGL